MNPHVRYAAIRDHLYSNLSDEGVVLNTRNGKYYGLKGAGVVIWNLLKKPSTVEEIFTALIDQYEVDETKCRRDIRVFLLGLIDEGLIEIVEEVPA